MYEIRYYSKTRRNSVLRRRRRAKALFITLMFLPILLFLVYKFLSPTTESVVGIISPLAKDVMEKGLSIINPDVNSKALKEIVQSQLKETKGIYAVYIKNLNTRERYYFNEQKKFDTASIYKLYVLATAFSQIQKGKFSESDVLSQDIAVLNEKFNIATESAELTEGRLTLPVRVVMERMIAISDNYSALLLSEKVRIANINSFLQENSFSQTKMGGINTSPVTSAYDTGLFFEKLYKGELANQIYTDRMLNLLKNQKKNTKFSKYLPQDTVIAHKTGELGDISHDAGIVYTAKGDYIIVVLSQTASPLSADEKIADISKAVYNYFIN